MACMLPNSSRVHISPGFTKLEHPPPAKAPPHRAQAQATQETAEAPASGPAAGCTVTSQLQQPGTCMHADSLPQSPAESPRRSWSNDDRCRTNTHRSDIRCACMFWSVAQLPPGLPERASAPCMRRSRRTLPCTASAPWHQPLRAADAGKCCDYFPLDPDCGLHSRQNTAS